MRCWAKRSQLKVIRPFLALAPMGIAQTAIKTMDGTRPAWHGVPYRARNSPGGLGTGGSANKPVRRTLAWGGVHRAGGGEHRPTQRVGPRRPGTTDGPAASPDSHSVGKWQAGPAARTALARAGNRGNGCAPHGALKSVLQRCSAHRPRTGSGIAAQKTVKARPVSVDCYEKSKPVASQPATGFSVRLPRAGGRPPRTAPTQGGFSGPACHGTFFAVEGRCGRARRGPPR